MNKVLFICLVSLSICFSSPAGKEGKPIQDAPIAANPEAPAELKPQLPVTEPTKTAKNETAVSSTVVTPSKVPVPPPAQVHNETATGKNESAAGKNETTTPVIDNKTENKTAVTEKAVSSTEKPNSAASTIKPDNKKNETTSEKPATVVPVTTPKAEDKHDVVLQSRAFDGPSFIGGIILTLGMLAVGFIGFRYYKSQTERNYHTL